MFDVIVCNANGGKKTLVVRDLSELMTFFKVHNAVKVIVPVLGVTITQ